MQSFREKQEKDSGWINAGFMVVEPKVIDYIENDTVMFEQEPLENLAAEGKLSCFRHNGFWKCMDTLKDKILLEELSNNGTAPWMVWRRNECI